MTDKLSRRVTLAGLAALWPTLGRAAVPTPAQTEGPFYPPPADRAADTDWDLVKIAGRVREAGGEVLHLEGRVLDREGAPLAGVRVEIWQCDVNGRYRHSRDWSLTRSPDEDFQGFGHTVTDAEGRYRFRTIKPVAYPGRTPHIHAKVHRRDGSVLTTQIYLADERANQSDGIFRSLGAKGQAAASMSPERRDDGDLAATFDFVA